MRPAARTLRTRSLDCSLFVWNDPPATPARAVAVVYHGLGAHARFPTVRFAAELLCAHGFVVFALDLPGHGCSPGTRGLIESADALVADGLAVARHAAAAHPSLPLFLVGSSLGGAIALAVSSALASEGAPPEGVVLLAPMLAVAVPFWQRVLLRLLAFILPALPLIPSSASSSESQYRDRERREEVEADELSFKGKLLPAAASACVELALRTRAALAEVSAPWLCLVATQDAVVDNSGADELLALSQTAPQLRELRRYEALHGLLCEPMPLRGELERDILAWLNGRIDAL